MAFTLNDIEFKPHPVFKGGICGSMKIGQYTMSVISGGDGQTGCSSSYGHLVEDFKADGITYDSSTFEVAIWVTETNEWVTDDLFPHLSGGGGVIGWRSAADVDNLIHTLFQMEWGNGRVEHSRWFIKRKLSKDLVK